MVDCGKMRARRVLVTGSGTGIGRGVAIEFAKEGAAVALHYSHSKAGALSAVQEIHESGGKAAAFQADFNDVEEAKGLIAAGADFLGGLDVLVNNAGITMSRPFLEVTQEQFDTVFHVNIRAMFFAAQAGASVMLKQGGGVIINTSEADTRVLVQNGETAIIAGLIRRVESKLETGIPLLKDMPVLGWLFRSESKIDNDRELVIFVTPRIVGEGYMNRDTLSFDGTTIMGTNSDDF